MRRILIALALLLLGSPAASALAATERPIIYLVVVDGLDGDRVDAGALPKLGAELASKGTYWRQSRSVMIAETNPNHSAMVTGAYGATSGIPGNAFALYAPLENEDTCRTTGPEDLSKAPSPTSGEHSSCLTAETVFAAIRKQGNPDGLTTAFATGKPKLGRIFAQKTVDPQRFDADFVWAPCDAGPDDEEYCGDVPLNPVSRYAIDDKTVMDVVLRTITDGVGPAKRRPDFTFVNLHQVDSAGHGFGTESGAYATAIKQADDQIARLVGVLKEREEWDRTVLFVVSDHSMDTTLTKTNLQSRITRAGVSEDDFVIVQNGSVDAIYLANRIAPDRFEKLARIRAAVLAEPRVAEALYREANPEDGGTAHTVDSVHPGWHAAGPRSADLLVLHEPGGAFSDPAFDDNPLPGNHGGPNTLDNAFLVTGGSDALVRQTLDAPARPSFDDTIENRMQAENVDAAPTIMSLLGLEPPRDNAGRFLGEAFDLAELPGAAKPANRPSLRVRARRGARFRVTATKTAGRFTEIAVRSRRANRWTRVARGRGLETRTYRGRPGKTYDFRARVRSFAGVKSDYVVVRRAARP